MATLPTPRGRWMLPNASSLFGRYGICITLREPGTCTRLVIARSSSPDEDPLRACCIPEQNRRAHSREGQRDCQNSNGREWCGCSVLHRFFFACLTFLQGRLSLNPWVQSVDVRSPLRSSSPVFQCLCALSLMANSAAANCSCVEQARHGSNGSLRKASAATVA